MKTFIFETIVYLSDTNAFQNAYFARYFDWQGSAREEFLRQTCSDIKSLMQSGIIIKTLEASMQYKKDAYLFDQIVIEVKPFNVNLASYELSFIFRNKKSNEIIGIGHEKIAYMNTKGRFVPIPFEIIEKGLDYLENKKDIMKAQFLIKAKHIYKKLTRT
jgi:acyl-CoA thioesterase FadM